jgi:hypothetical protein
LLGARNVAVAKPTKHRGKWRIRWVDEKGERQSAVFDDYRRAQTELSRHQVEVEEIKRGVRNAPPRAIVPLTRPSSRGTARSPRRRTTHPPAVPSTKGPTAGTRPSSLARPRSPRVPVTCRPTASAARPAPPLVDHHATTAFLEGQLDHRGLARPEVGARDEVQRLHERGEAKPKAARRARARDERPPRAPRAPRQARGTRRAVAQ